MRLSVFASTNFIISGNLVYESLLHLLCESIDDTVILDVDETLLTVKTDPSICVDSLSKQNKDLSIENEPRNITDEELYELVNNYKYSNYVKLNTHPVTNRLALIIFRPHLCKLFATLSDLQNNHKLKQYVLFTANSTNIAIWLKQNIADHCGTAPNLWRNERPKISQDSLLVDDDINNILIKLRAMQLISKQDVMDQNTTLASKFSYQITKFKGNLNDSELLYVAQKIKAKYE